MPQAQGLNFAALHFGSHTGIIAVWCFKPVFCFSIHATEVTTFTGPQYTRLLSNAPARTIQLSCNSPASSSNPAQPQALAWICPGTHCCLVAGHMSCHGMWILALGNIQMHDHAPAGVEIHEFTLPCPCLLHALMLVLSSA